MEKKGLLSGIEEICHVADHGIDVEYSIVADGPLRFSTEQRISELGLEERVHLVGRRPQEEVARLLHDNHILLVPSRAAVDGDEEGLPVVLMEALSTGMPVVAANHTAIPELVDDGVDGFLAPEGDAEALGAQLSRIASMSAAWAGMGCHGRRTVEHRHNIARLDARLEAILDDVALRYGAG